MVSEKRKEGLRRQKTYMEKRCPERLYPNRYFNSPINEPQLTQDLRIRGNRHKSGAMEGVNRLLKLGECCQISTLSKTFVSTNSQVF